MKLPKFNYTLVRELPLSNLGRFSNHKRLRVFVEKGCKCVSCGREGTRLIEGRDNGGTCHVDLYTNDLHPLTVDHIVPKSKGGTNLMDNLQPMCYKCNQLKRDIVKGCDNPITQHKDVYKRVEGVGNDLVGQIVYKVRSNGNTDQKSIYLGEVIRVEPNPYSNTMSAVVDTGKESWFPLSKLYVHAA